MIDLMNSFRFNCSEGLKSHGFRELKKSLPSFRPYLLSEHNDKFLSSDYVDFKSVNECVDIYYNKEFKVYATCDAEHGTIGLEAKSKQHKGYVDAWEFDLDWLFSSPTLRDEDYYVTASGIDRDVCCEHDGKGCGCYTNLQWVLPHITSSYHNNPIPSGTSKKVVKFDRTKYMMMNGNVLINN